MSILTANWSAFLPRTSYFTEPGGQRFATRPYGSTVELREELFQFVETLRSICDDETYNCHRPTTRSNRRDHPSHAKNRYDIMRSYLPQYGSLALNMMHLTASMHGRLF